MHSSGFGLATGMLICFASFKTSISLMFKCRMKLPAWFEVDHKIRLDRGGTNEVDNLVAYCRNCHGEKTAMENI